MQLSRRRLLQLTTVAGAASVLGGRFAFAKEPQVLRIGLSTYPPHFRPWVNIGWSGHLLFSLVNRSLINYDEQGKLVGELVESWSAVNPTTWEFKLREAKFHDGSPVTSADVKWNFDEIAKPKSGAYMFDALKVIKAFETVDERTFRLITEGPVATVPALMAFPFFTILKAESTASEPQGIGAGPYRITAAEKGVSIELKPNEHYFKGPPPLKGIIVTPYADESARVAAVTAGDVDLVDYVPWSAMAAIEANPALKLFKKDAGPFMYLSFNGSGPFKDARLRQAVAFGLRRDEFVKSVFFGFGAEMRGLPRAAGTPYYHEDQATYWGYDPDRARALLKEAGHEKGFEVTLLATSQYSMHRDIAVLVQSQLAEIGIKVNLQLPDWATRISLGNRGVGDFAVQGNALDIIDPDATRSIVDPTLTPTYLRSRNFKVEGLPELYAQGVQELDEAKRVAIYKQADQLALEGTAICGLAYRAQGYATSAAVQTVPLLPDQISVYSAVNFDRIALD
ncbi:MULTISPECIES: ABC transporter substrate-binding protein [unclassified Chelatococcus]|uniref:ABC transporter substrate-binding protein n=1 Tax=unclassified Chelatococcus TaxID=2638111 RepID=UPI001BCD55BF|nr:MULTISPECIES: ABC transporter substrate-binding protein [unclassified Chelatococcus]MBS7699905.1 agropinic acid transporter substrate-binding protein [Chelatococcus sp. YT9]MBX3558749.1 agropinic acid transporter substrate-binding protein [Chelatococcus sp.]